MKTFKYMFIGAIAVMTAGCAVEAVDSIEGNTSSPVLEEMTFSASLSSDNSAETKTMLAVDGLSVLWCEGDQISINTAPFNEPFSIVYDPESPAEATFTGSAEASDVYYAVYPASAVMGWEGSKAIISCNDHTYEPTLQNGTFSSGSAIAVASTTAEEKSFTFKNLLAFIKFTIDANSGPIQKIRVASNNQEDQLFISHFTVDCSAEEPTISDPYGMYYTEIYAANGYRLDEGTYYIPVFPGTYESGLELIFITPEGYELPRSINTSVTFNRGEIKNIGTVSGLNIGTTDPALSAAGTWSRTLWFSTYRFPELGIDPNDDFEAYLSSDPNSWTKMADDEWSALDWTGLDLSIGKGTRVIINGYSYTDTYGRIAILPKDGSRIENPLSSIFHENECSIDSYVFKDFNIDLNSGFIISGHDAVINKVDIVTDATRLTEYTFWEGSHALEESSYLDLSGSLYCSKLNMNLPDNAVLHIEYDATSSEPKLKVSTDDGNNNLTSIWWTESSGMTYQTDYASLSPDSGSVSYVLRAYSDISGLRNTGMKVYGSGLTIKRIYFTLDMSQVGDSSIESLTDGGSSLQLF